MHDILVCALSLATGLAIAEYYNRGRIDAIRREQLRTSKKSGLTSQIWSRQHGAYSALATYTASSTMTTKENGMDGDRNVRNRESEA